MSVGPRMVAAQCVREVVGKAEMPGVGDVINVMSSDWRRLVTLPAGAVEEGGADLVVCVVEAEVLERVSILLAMLWLR